jgi:hypothetical protein
MRKTQGNRKRFVRNQKKAENQNHVTKERKIKTINSTVQGNYVVKRSCQFHHSPVVSLAVFSTVVVSLLSCLFPSGRSDKGAMRAYCRTRRPGSLSVLLIKGESRSGGRELAGNVQLADAHVGVVSNDLGKECTGFVSTLTFKAAESIRALSTGSLSAIGG